MSLARSASGPGGLTINTGAANSLTVPSSQPPSQGGLFGSNNASANPSTASAGGMASTGGGLFGGGTQQKPATSLFGTSTATANTQPSTGGGLFGASTANTQQTQQTQQSGGLFGNNQQQQSGGGGLFGNTANATTTQQPQQQQQATGGGLFGQSTQNQQQPQQQSTGGGLFGNAGAQQQSGGGLFGQSTQTQQQPQQTGGGGLFGASTAQTGTTGGGLFGQSQAKPGGGLFGQTQPQQAQASNQVAAVQVNYDSLRPRSRFDDLAKPVQDEIALIDKGIQRVIKMKDQIGEFMPQHEKDIEQLGRDVQFVESKFRTVQIALDRDIQTVKVLQDMTKKNIADAQLSFKATDNLKLPTHYHQTGLFAGPTPSADSNAAGASSAHANAQDLITYFNRICDDVEKYKKRLDEYRGEIERDMPGVENGLYEQIKTFRERSNSAGAGAAGGAVQDQLGQVLLALRETGNAIVGQAGQIADTRERLSRLQAGILDSGLYSMGMAT